MDTKRILIAEDHVILREGLRALLSSEPDLTVVGEAGDGREAIRQVEELLPDLILMDLSMPRMNGIEAIQEIRRRCPSTRILVLTVHKTEEHVLAALKAGADGYVLKEATGDEFKMAARSVLAGHPYLSPGVSHKVIQGYLEGTKAKAPSTPWDTLTSREREVLKLIGEGYKNKEIAAELYISPKTVEKHRANLMRKLDLHTTAQLTTLAVEKGLVTR